MTKEFRYFLRCERYIPQLIITIGCSIYLFLLAQSNERRLRIDRLIMLDSKQANTFFFVAASILMIISIAIIASSIFERKNMVMNNEAISIPVMFIGRPNTIYYNEIAYIADQQITTQRICIIVTKYNKRYSILMNAFDSIDEYNEILSILNEKIKIAKQKSI